MDSAQNYNNSSFRGVTVEEVPTAQNQTSVLETPPIPHAEFDKPPQPEHLPVVQTPLYTPQVTPPPPIFPPVSTSNLPPEGHQVEGRSGQWKKLLFLIPAILIIITIIAVSKLTGNSFTVRMPELMSTPVPEVDEVLISPTPTPIPTISYTSETLLIELTMPEKYEILAEEENILSLGRAGREVILISRFSDAKHQNQEAEKTQINGRQAEIFEGSIYLLVEPYYQISLFPEDEKEVEEVNAIINSIVFLVDTAGWETHENSASGFLFKYPEDWEENNSGAQVRISRRPDDTSLHSLVVQTSSNNTNAALTASNIISSTRTLSGWSSPPLIEYKKLGGGDAQIIQGELSGKWRAYVVVWYKNTVVQMTWDDEPSRPLQQIFDNILASFEFTT